jgi:hypothetical protein
MKIRFTLDSSDEMFNEFPLPSMLQISKWTEFRFGSFEIRRRGFVV